MNKSVLRLGLGTPQLFHWKSFSSLNLGLGVKLDENPVCLYSHKYSHVVFYCARPAASDQHLKAPEGQHHVSAVCDS